MHLEMQDCVAGREIYMCREKERETHVLYIGLECHVCEIHVFVLYSCDFPSSPLAVPLMLHRCIFVPAKLWHRMPILSGDTCHGHVARAMRVHVPKWACRNQHRFECIVIATYRSSPQSWQTDSTCVSVDSGSYRGQAADMCHRGDGAYPGPFVTAPRSSLLRCSCQRPWVAYRRCTLDLAMQIHVKTCLQNFCICYFVALYM